MLGENDPSEEEPAPSGVPDEASFIDIKTPSIYFINTVAAYPLPA